MSLYQTIPLCVGHQENINNRSYRYNFVVHLMHMNVYLKELHKLKIQNYRKLSADAALEGVEFMTKTNI